MMECMQAVRRARVVKGMDWKPIVISRAGSSPADDAKCKVMRGATPVSLPCLSIEYVLDVTHLCWLRRDRR